MFWPCPQQLVVATPLGCAGESTQDSVPSVLVPTGLGLAASACFPIPGDCPRSHLLALRSGHTRERQVPGWSVFRPRQIAPPILLPCAVPEAAPARTHRQSTSNTNLGADRFFFIELGFAEY